MSEKREILGQWWLPTQPDEKWVGTLTLEPGKSPRLTVTIPKGFFQLPAQHTSPVLHGHDKHGKPITRMVYNLTIYEVAYRALRRSTAMDSAAWSRIDCRIQRTNLTLRWVARRACRTRVDRSWPAAAHFWAAASVRLIRR